MERLLPHLQLIPSIQLWAACTRTATGISINTTGKYNVKVRATPAKRLPHVWAPIIRSRKRMHNGGGGGGGCRRSPTLTQTTCSCETEGLKTNTKVDVQGYHGDMVHTQPQTCSTTRKQLMQDEKSVKSKH